MFWAEIWKNIRIFIWKLSVFVMKFSIYLHRRAFVMFCQGNKGIGTISPGRPSLLDDQNHISFIYVQFRSINRCSRYWSLIMEMHFELTKCHFRLFPMEIRWVHNGLWIVFARTHLINKTMNQCWNLLHCMLKVPLKFILFQLFNVLIINEIEHKVSPIYSGSFMEAVKKL